MLQNINSDVSLFNINSTRLYTLNYFPYQAVYTVDDVREQNNIEAVLPNTEEDNLSISTYNEDNDTEVPLEKNTFQQLITSF